MFINHKVCTDIESFKVLSINGNKGRAIRVQKKPVGLISIPGGYGAHHPNQHEAYANSTDIFEVGEAFDIFCRGGVWGCWVIDCIRFFGVSEKEAKKQKKHAELIGIGCEIIEDGDGTYTIHITTLTPKGRPKRNFKKLGVIEETCRYFYDHNF